MRYLRRRTSGGPRWIGSAAAVAAAAVALTACGGGGFFSHTTESYTVTVTAVSGADTHTVDVTLTVQ